MSSYWLWPLRLPSAQRLELARVLEAGAGWMIRGRWLAIAAAAGVLPLLVFYACGFPGHRAATAVLVFPVFVCLVRQDRQRAGFLTVLVCFAAHSLTAILLTTLDPAGTAPLLSGGQEYWEKNYRWIRTGVDPEYELANWLPAHLQQLGAMAAYAYTSLGLVPLAQGLYEIDLMNFYVGRLIPCSRSAPVALLVGWHFWAILRGVAYTRIVFEVASFSLSHLTGIELSTRRRRATRWSVGLGLLLLDGVAKYLALAPVRDILANNLVPT